MSATKKRKISETEHATQDTPAESRQLAEELFQLIRGDLDRTLPDLWVEAYCQYLVARRQLGDFNATMLSPSTRVDRVWHKHLMRPVSYIKAMRALGLHGDRILDHRPEGANEGVAQQKRLELSRDVCAAMFGERFVHSMWIEDDEDVRWDMSVQIVSLTGKHTELRTRSSATIGDLRQQYADQKKTDAAFWRLIFAGKQLDDDTKTLREVGLRNGSSLHAIGKVRGC